VSYNISSIIDLAAFRSAVAKPSVNRNWCKKLRAEHCDQASLAVCWARCGSGPAKLPALAVVAIGVDKAAAEAKDAGMELSTYALHDNAALVLCRSHHGTRKSPRCLDEADHGHIRTSVGRRLAPAPGGAIGRKVS
jgi:hypothetical protein